MKMVKFAIIGCGRIAYRHIEAIGTHKGAKLVSLCDLNLDRAADILDQIEQPVPIYRDYREMFSKEEIDVVCIMTPSGMHPEHAVEVMETYGKHVVLEKPVAMRIEDGERILAVTQKTGCRVFPVHQNRFNKAVQKIKEGVSSGIFGKISLATVRIRWSRGQGYYDRDPWRGTWGLDGGALTNLSIHHLDLLQWIMGEVESVSGITKTQFVDVPVEDLGCAWVKFESGALGLIEATTTVRPKDDLEASISILGENGVAVVDGPAVNKLKTWTFEDIDLKPYSENPPNVYGYGHDVLLDNVVGVIRGEQKQLISVEDAMGSIRLLNAIYTSAEQGGKEVFMRDNPKSKRFGILDDEEICSIASLYRVKEVLDQ